MVDKSIVNTTKFCRNKKWWHYCKRLMMLKNLSAFVYRFAGFKDSKAYLCSHMLGIDENYRSKQIGQRLKFA